MKKMIQDRYESNQRNSVKSIIPEVTLAVVLSQYHLVLLGISIHNVREKPYLNWVFLCKVNNNLCGI